MVCRSWVWQNQEFSEPPVEMLEGLLVEAPLKEFYVRNGTPDHLG